MTIETVVAFLTLSFQFRIGILFNRVVPPLASETDLAVFAPSERGEFYFADSGRAVTG